MEKGRMVKEGEGYMEKGRMEKGRMEKEGE